MSSHNNVDLVQYDLVYFRQHFEILQNNLVTSNNDMLFILNELAHLEKVYLEIRSDTNFMYDLNLTDDTKRQRKLYVNNEIGNYFYEQKEFILSQIPKQTIESFLLEYPDRRYFFENLSGPTPLEHIDELHELSVVESQLISDYQSHELEMDFEIKGAGVTRLKSAVLEFVHAKKSKKRHIAQQIDQGMMLYSTRLNQFFIKLVRIRNKKAEIMGYKNSIIAHYDGFLIGLDKIEDYCRMVIDQSNKQIAELLNMKLDVSGTRPPLLPQDRFDLLHTKPKQHLWKSTGEFSEFFIKLIEQVNPEWIHYRTDLLDISAIDFEFRDDKRRGAGIYLRPLTGTPLMMLNISASIDGVEQAAHELGHVVHFGLISAHQNYLLSDVGSEVSELFSHSFELFALEEMRYFMSEKDYKICYDYYFIKFFEELRRSCMYELFHLKAYTNDHLTTKTLADDWLEIIGYADDGLVDRSNSPHWQKYEWQHHGHTFRYSFYTIHYVIGKVGAMQLLQKYRKNKSATLQLVSEVMKKGATISSKETYEMLGIDLFTDRDSFLIS